MAKSIVCILEVLSHRRMISSPLSRTERNLMKAVIASTEDCTLRQCADNVRRTLFGLSRTFVERRLVSQNVRRTWNE
ncbi:hypothetical protein AAMO2058_001117100 [Amorphochlora amoebiformis]